MNMTFWIYLVLAWVGALAVVFSNLASFSQSTKKVNDLTTIKVWWSLNAYTTIFSYIVISLVSFLLTVPGGDWLIEALSGGKLTGDTPFGFYLIAAASGFIIQFAFDKWRGIKNPIQFDLRDVAAKTDISKNEIIAPKDGINPGQG